MNNCTVTNFYLEDWYSDTILLRHLLEHWSTSHILFFVVRRSKFVPVLKVIRNQSKHRQDSRVVVVDVGMAVGMRRRMDDQISNHKESTNKILLWNLITRWSVYVVLNRVGRLNALEPVKHRNMPRRRVKRMVANLIARVIPLQSSAALKLARVIHSSNLLQW